MTVTMSSSRRSGLAASLFSGLAIADWQFKSRTDLAVPRLNITIPATEEAESGYIFVAPLAGYQDTPTEQHGARQASPYIFRDDGDLIWSGYGYYSIWPTNFQAGRWDGKDILYSRPTWLLAHVSEAVLPINPGQAGSGYNSSDAWDYLHINSVDKDRAGDYLVSARDACAVHKIDGTDGSIIWRLDGKASDFSVPDDTKFCFQHDARFLEQHDDVEVMSLYDNSAHGTEHGSGSEVHTAPTSSGKIIKVNTTSWEAELVRGFYPPENDLLSKSQGSTRVLPNGNGSEGAVTEYTADGTAVFHAYMDSGDLGVGVENCRGFRHNWTGIPNEEPAIVALEAEVLPASGQAERIVVVEDATGTRKHDGSNWDEHAILKPVRIQESPELWMLQRREPDYRAVVNAPR
ncbi:LOW QUALITY PROTEIN: Arylsulfotransferase (ASST) [Geosmithia morbida]|uniref:Arylsulfotransferase (ASST) n=1 Tax=Geosmithia morbida TaxID=1094350 RepID=A0A9P5D354_9HYPO|nr:LOW QUALITY PROTEIN: Arylsulfotransferase (ASST) [Geosmithia morbida]KAF4124547.1 LOW QUALITY PROTEIN: Arylsulfotransferase (ASST) [Geosmithia morbida]